MNQVSWVLNEKNRFFSKFSGTREKASLTVSIKCFPFIFLGYSSVKSASKYVSLSVSY